MQKILGLVLLLCILGVEGSKYGYREDTNKQSSNSHYSYFQQNRNTESLQNNITQLTTTPPQKPATIIQMDRQIQKKALISALERELKK